MIYVFDTNSLSEINAYYPNVFKSFWQEFNAATARGFVVSTREVLTELERSGRPHILAWAKSNTAIFSTPAAAETAFVAEIFRAPHFQSLISRQAILRGTPVADPFVIACARIRLGKVVTEEKVKLHAAKIPNVCAHFGIPYTNLHGFLQEMGWSF